MYHQIFLVVVKCSLCPLAESSKVNMPNLVTYRNQTPKFVWYVIKYGSKNGHQEDMFIKEIGLCV